MLGTMPKVDDETPGELAGNGTEEEPYLIQSIEDLIAFSQKVNQGNAFENKYVKLSQSLDFNSENSYANYAGSEIFGDYNEDGSIKGIKEEVTETGQRGFIPIGSKQVLSNSEGGYTGNFFAGVFDGNNKVIANMYMKENNSNAILLSGLFGGNVGQIKNLKVTGNLFVEGEIEWRTTNKIFGGLVAYNEGKIENCHSIVNEYVEEFSTAGGLVGYNYGGNIEKCFNYGTIQITVGGYDLGGLIGIMENGNITNSGNNGNIVINSRESGNGYIGGIAGEATTNVKILNSYNSGNIYVEYDTSGPECGGIAGWADEFEIENCYNIGNITTFCGWTYTGGLIGDTSTGKITNCYNAGNLNCNIKYPESGDTCFVRLRGNWTVFCSM